MKQKIFTLFLALAASAGTIFALEYKHVQIGDLYYNLDATNKTAEVTSQISYYPYWSATIATANISSSVEYEGVIYSVTSIGGSAFWGCSGLTSVTIPNSVTSIGGSAFSGCKSLTSVTIPNSVTSMGDRAFYGCSSMPVIDNIRYADTYLVEAVDKTLSTYTIKDGTKWIGSDAFSGCSGLTSITIPNSVTSIGGAVFSRCSGLTSVTIPNSVTSIGASAFIDCTGLTSVTIPNSITSIGGSAFCGCKSLTSVTIPNSVTSIGDHAFQSCTGLTSVTIPNSVTSIGSSAFWGCKSLTSVTIPNSVTSIGGSAFKGCSGLTSVTIPNSVTSIDGSAFEGCSGLTSVTIPNSVTSIGYHAFYKCSGLTSVTIPNSVTEIGIEAFYKCTGLTSVTCEASTPPACGSDVFLEVDKSIPLYVPFGSVDAYKTADQWKDFTNVLPIQQAEESTVTDLEAEPTENSVVIEWPKVNEATVYTIEIKKNGELICTLTFNELGQLQGIAFAKPARNGGRDSQVRTAIQTTTGWQYTISGLEANTTYTYNVIAKRNASDTDNLYNETITFTTKKTPTSVDEIQESSDTEVLKFINNGQLLILRDGEIYNASGARVE